MSTLQPEMQQIWHPMNINKPKFPPGVQVHPAVPPPILFSKSVPGGGSLAPFDPPLNLPLRRQVHMNNTSAFKEYWGEPELIYIVKIDTYAVVSQHC